MAQIPIGNFGQTVVQPGRGQRVFAEQADAADARLMAEIGEKVGQVALERVEAATRERQEELEQQQSNQAASAALKFETALKAKQMEFAAKVESGEIKPEEADRLWSDEAGRLRDEFISPLQSAMVGRSGAKIANAASLRAEQLLAASGLQVSGSVFLAKKGRYASQANEALDELGKQAAMPQENLEAVFSKADTVFPTMAQRAGMDPAKSAEKLQNWKDGVRFNRARVDLIGSRRSLEALDAFTQRLESGDLAGTLDADKRTMLVKEAESAKWQIQQGLQHAADKREKVAERAVGAVTRQIESGVPVTVEGWQDLRTKVEGTAFASDFNALVTQEREVQQVLRMPIGQQEAYVQQREAKLAQDGGTLVDRANLQRIKATIETNKKELEQAPLLAAQRLMGRKFEPLNLADLMAPGGAHRAAEVFADRTATLQGMSRQFGVRVGQKPLLPQEQAILAAGIDAASPSEAVNLFGLLRSAINDDGTYRAVMQQIAPDSPVKARAGILAASSKHITLQDNLITDDVRVPGAKIAQTMLAGEQILNRTKKQRAEDGQARTLFTPPREAFSQSFADAVGDLYRGRPGAQEQDLQAAYAYYVGKAAELGKTSDGSVDSALAKEAVTATLGAVVDVNGQGRVKAPLGMSSSDFEEKAREQFTQEVRRRNLPASMLNEWPHYGLQDYRRDGTYVLTVGGQPVVDPATRAPVIIDLDPPPPSGLRYRSAADLIPKDGAPTRAQGGAKR